MSRAIKRLLLNDGNSVPWLAFGTGTALYNKDAREATLRAIAAGFVHLDGAQMYKNEDSLGDAIKESDVPRSELYVTTKLQHLDGGRTVEDTLRESLSKLKTDYVDLFLIHSPSKHQQYPGRLKEVWQQMIEVKKAGLTKSIGVSNFSIKHLEEIIGPDTEPPAVNQIEYHPFVFTNSVPLLEFHKAHGIITSSYGGLTPILPRRAGDASLEPARKALVQALDNARNARGESITQNQILLKWLEQKDILAVTTSTKESRLKEYITTSEIPDLSAEEIQGIESAVTGVHFRVFG